MTTAAKAFLCPTCSSPYVTTPALVGGNYKCGACGWEGQDALLIPFGNPYGSENATMDAFSADLLKEFAKAAALPVGLVLVKWGFVPRDAKGKPITAILARYMKAMAGGMVTALLMECRDIELEKVHGKLD